jgi:RNA polymerase sigma factor (sigma-70 family)
MVRAISTSVGKEKEPSYILGRPVTNSSLRFNWRGYPIVDVGKVRAYSEIPIAVLVSLTIRAEGRRKMTAPSDEVALAAADAGSRAALESESGPSASETAPTREREEAVRRALAQLPEDYRQVLLLRYQEGASFEVISLQMGKSPQAAQELFVRALEQMHLELEGPP